MKKRLFSALLILVMLISVLTVSAFAAEKNESELPVPATADPETDHGAKGTSNVEHALVDATKNGTCDAKGCNYHYHFDDNGNGVCDGSGCSQKIEHKHVDSNGNHKCDVEWCTDVVCYDEDTDGYCDECDLCQHEKDTDGFCKLGIPCKHEATCTCGGSGHEHYDNNKNTICDADGCSEHIHADYNGNGVCDGEKCSEKMAHKHYDNTVPKNYICDAKYCTEHVHNDTDDGFCDDKNCGACLHTKKNGYCSDKDCKHKDCTTCGGAKPVEKPPVKTYIIKAGDSKHGDIRPEGKVEVTEGGSKTFYFTPDKGYEVSAIYIDGYKIDGDGYCCVHKCACKDHKWVCKDHKWICNGILSDYIDYSRWFDCDDCKWDWDCAWEYYCHSSCCWVLGENKITFKNVQGDHSLYVEFAPVKEECPSAAYKDLNTSAWYHEATDYVIENGLMKGVSATRFDPSGATTRGQLVTMLYRLAGEPAVSGESEFKDVASGEWYSKAVVWAAKKGIVTGYGDGTFGVDDVVTREQTVAILYRYAKYMKCDVSDLADLEAFLDADDVSEYAEDAFGWAVEEEIVNGKPVGKKYELDPQGTTIRVEMAALLMRFAEYVD